MQKVIIPFFDYVVTKDNFNDVTNFENTSIKIVRNKENNIVIEFKNTFPSNFFYVDVNGNKYLSLLEENLAKYLKENNICEVTERKEYADWAELKQVCKRLWRVGSLKSNKYSPIERTTKLWKTITVYPDCSFDIEYWEDTEISSVPIRESGEIIKNWIIKYRDILRSYDPDDLIFELSAGLDSRALTWFFRHNEKEYTIYSKMDEKELPIVRQIAKRLPIKNFFTSKKGVRGITISGVGNWSGSFPNSEILENYVGIHYSKHLIKDICPYLDREFQKIYGDYPQQIKVVMQILLAKDLMDLPYISFKDQFYDFSEEKINEANTIINEYLKINIDELK